MDWAWGEALGGGALWCTCSCVSSMELSYAGMVVFQLDRTGAARRCLKCYSCGCCSPAPAPGGPACPYEAGVLVHVGGAGHVLRQSQCASLARAYGGQQRGLTRVLPQPLATEVL